MNVPKRMAIFLVGLTLAVAWWLPASASDPILVKDINPAGSSTPHMLRGVDGSTYFRATDGVTGVEIWTSDGTDAGTFLVRDILPGAQGSYPSGFTRFGGAIYFSAEEGLLGQELWRTDGTGPGTLLTRDINPGAADSWPGVGSNFVAAAGTLFFVAYTNSAGYELWKTDGTPAGTALVRDIYPGQEGSALNYFTPFNGKLFFRADDGSLSSNRELWESDGTLEGTKLVRDINPTGGSDASGFVHLDGLLLFEADDGVHGTELWRTDGTEAGTVMVKDIHPAGGSNPAQLRVSNGNVFFVANDGTNGAELWKSNGTAEGTAMVVDLTPSGHSSINQLIAVDGSLFFAKLSGPLATQLWTSDGTAAGTVMLREFAPGNYHPMVENLTDVNGTLYFTANDGVHGVELWKSDGTSEGTVLAGDIYQGDEWSFSWPQELRNVDGVLFFAADDGVHGRELWALDARGTTGIPGDLEVSPPGAIALHENVPNPFTLATTLRFDLAAATNLSVTIYDAAGRCIRRLHPGSRLEAGPHAFRWDGRNDAGREATSGVYFYRLDAAGSHQMGRMVLAR